MAANRDYSLLTFSQQLRLLTAALDSKDPKRIARYLIPFALLYDPETKCEEIRKNGATIKRSPLLDHVVDNLVNAKPLIFLKYLRILVQVDSYEDDIFASEAVTLVIDVMENNKNDEDVLVSALKFLGSMATSAPIRDELASNEDLIVMVVKLMDSPNYRQADKFLTAALLFLTNVAVENVENKELVSVESIPTVLACLRTVNDIRTNLAALYLLKNLVTESPREIVKDVVDNGGVSNIFKAMDRFPNSIAIVSMGLSCLIHLLHQRVKAKKQVTETNIQTLLSVIKKHKLKLDVVTSGITVWLQLAKLCTISLLHSLTRVAEKRGWLGEEVIEIVCGALRQWSDNAEFVCLSSILLERMLYTEANIDGLDAEEDIPHFLKLLAKHPEEAVIHLAIIRLLCRIAEFPDAKDIIKAEGGMSVIITSLNHFDSPSIKFFATQTVDLICREDETETEESENAESEVASSAEEGSESEKDTDGEMGEEESGSEESGTGEESEKDESSESPEQAPAVPHATTPSKPSPRAEPVATRPQYTGSPSQDRERQRKLEDQAREGEKKLKQGQSTQTPENANLAFADINPTLPMWQQRLLQRKRDQELKQQQQ